MPDKSIMPRAPRSVSQRKLVAFLEESGNQDLYRKMCGCYRCRNVMREFQQWKNEKQAGSNERCH